VDIATRLKLVRQILGPLSQKEMARRCSVSTQMWQVYEGGGSIPGGKVLESLSRLGVSVDCLLTGEGELLKIKWPVRIFKEEHDDVGRPFEISYNLDQLFGARIVERMKELGNKNIQWLAEETKLSKQLIEGFIYKQTIPSFDELNCLADALRVNTAWIAEKSPHPGEHKEHENTAKALEWSSNTEDDLNRIDFATRLIEKHLSQYDFHLDSEKYITLMMTAFTLLDNDFCKKRDEIIDSLAGNLVKLCYPERNQPKVVDVTKHLNIAMGAVEAGDLDKARIEFTRCAKDWKEVVGLGDNRFPNELEQARKEFTDFVQSDPIYIEGVKTLLAVIKTNPGILQHELYNSCPGIDRKTVIYILNFAIIWGLIDRTDDHQLNTTR